MKPDKAHLVPGRQYILADNSCFTTVFECLSTIEPDDWSEYNSELRNVSTGWTFTAHGTNLYPGELFIDWDFSTNGRFEDIYE